MLPIEFCNLKTCSLSLKFHKNHLESLTKDCFSDSIFVEVISSEALTFRQETSSWRMKDIFYILDRLTYEKSNIRVVENNGIWLGGYM